MREAEDCVFCGCGLGEVEMVVMGLGRWRKVRNMNFILKIIFKFYILFFI